MPYLSHKYVDADTSCDRLVEELHDVETALDVALCGGSELYELSNGMYVHTYGSTLKCSSISLKMPSSSY